MLCFYMEDLPYEPQYIVVVNNVIFYDNIVVLTYTKYLRNCPCMYVVYMNDRIMFTFPLSWHISLTAAAALYVNVW